MARPKEFDPHAALKVAMETFRRRGYEGTSVQDLVDALGINRSSMYAAFGSKHDLYLKALERYSADEKAKAENALAGDGPALPALRAFLLSYVDAALTDPERNGCLVTHGVLERVPCDPEATTRLRAALRGMEDAYKGRGPGIPDRGRGPGAERRPRQVGRRRGSRRGRGDARRTRRRLTVADPPRPSLADQSPGGVGGAGAPTGDAILVPGRPLRRR
ncbi:TetR/AcrR family transcriptional regulator [Streptomyces noursei]|uniref:TetR/AcrR family transcriptional regulator n=1 Tax=Streptomyces noursei TaxID=1971 RepID=UPI00167B36DB|nr:TetR/AcrR family transcriptional regulator [Streptomyces noursei]MCZ1018559.1 TetR/AcrR family transcriptional regulator [Streptomyces noursei]